MVLITKQGKDYYKTGQLFEKKTFSRHYKTGQGSLQNEEAFLLQNGAKVITTGKLFYYKTVQGSLQKGADNTKRDKNYNTVQYTPHQ